MNVDKDKPKTAVITGSGRGIGKAIAKAYLDAGFIVIFAENNDEIGSQAEYEFQNCGLPAHFIQTDVSNVDSIVQLFQQIQERFGRLDVLVNNAGISEFCDPFELTENDWNRIIDTNLKGQFFCAREAAKMMKHQMSGAIVNIASTRAMMSEPNSEAYAASKGGIVSLTHALAASFSKYYISVNVILPGWIETGDYKQLSVNDHEQHFSQRVGAPDDIARACLFLTNPLNTFVSGTQLVIDGGMTKKMIYE